MPSHLPIELYKIIIDNLDRHRDVATLRACSLTCKAFLHASRVILFHDAHLKTAGQLGHLLKSATHLCPYVRRLFLYDMGGIVPWLDRALPLIARSLPHITSLRLDSLRWEMLNNRARSRLLSGFRHVQELEITSIRFETSAQLNELIASFPSLKKLSCGGAYWNTYLTPVIPLPLGITSIELDSFHAIFFDQLLSVGSSPIVRTIGFRLVYRHHLNDVGLLLKKLGSHVQYLDLGPPLSGVCHDPQFLFGSDINLSHNTNLRSIHMAAFRGFSEDYVCMLWSQITSPHLEQITLGMFSADVDEIEWPRIDHYFSQQRWANLHHLVLMLLDEPGFAPRTEELIEAGLPLLRDRGALVFGERTWIPSSQRPLTSRSIARFRIERNERIFI